MMNLEETTPGGGWGSIRRGRTEMSASSFASIPKIVALRSWGHMGVVKGNGGRGSGRA